MAVIRLASRLFFSVALVVASCDAFDVDLVPADASSETAGSGGTTPDSAGGRTTSDSTGGGTPLPDAPGDGGASDAPPDTPDSADAPGEGAADADGGCEPCACCEHPPNSTATCSDGACGFVCDDGLKKCPNACVDFDEDPLNCGACGHDCEGGDCEGGKCKPVILGTGDPDGYPTSLVLDTDKVYWSIAKFEQRWTASGIYWCDHSQCDAPPLSFASNTVNPKTMTLVPSGAGGASTLYWTDLTTQRIQSCPAGKICDAPAYVVDSGPVPVHLIHDAGVLYWVLRGTGEDRDGGIVSCAIDNCASSLRVIATEQWDPRSVAVDENYVYWTAKMFDTLQGGSKEPVVSILRCQKDFSCGKAGEVIVPNRLWLTSILVHQGFLYWTQAPTQTQGVYVDCLPGGSIWRCDLSAQCPPVPFGPNMHCPSLLTADGDLLYWVTSEGLFGGSGAIQRAGVHGDPNLTVFQSTDDVVNALAVGPTAVYWVTQNAVLSKLVK